MVARKSNNCERVPVAVDQLWCHGHSKEISSLTDVNYLFLSTQHLVQYGCPNRTNNSDIYKLYIHVTVHRKQSLCFEAVIRNLHATYQCLMYSRKLLMMDREDARNM
jgi:hypothetical protein